MRYDPSNKSRLFTKMAARFLKKTLKLLTLGISAQQWTACVLICALLSLSVAAPVGVSMPRAINNDSANYEPVNEDLSVFTSTLRDLDAEIEAKLTTWRNVDWSVDISDEKDESKKVVANNKQSDSDSTKKEGVPAENVTDESENIAGQPDEKSNASKPEENNFSSSLPTLSNDITANETENPTSALEKRVAGIKTEIKSSEEIKIGQLISLAARPVDRKGVVINGIVAKWNCADSKIVRILNDSEAIAVGEGETKLGVYLGKFVKEVAVKVVKGQGNKTPPNVLLTDPELPVITDQQAANLVTPENNLGNPVGQTEMSSRTSASATQTRERYGSSNYSFGVPAASLPGRGLDASVGITYNSRVWNKAGASGTRVFTFNVDNNWLAPGFETGFGDIIPFGGGNVSGYMLTGPEGTRHQLIYKQASGSCSIFESTDGTFIQTTICGIYTSSTLNVIFPDGTQVMYGGSTSSGKRFPVRITDRNGNMLNIAYVQGDAQGKIAYIRDTLNRYINFYYETGTSDKKLVAITVPGFNGGAERQTIRFYYEDLTLQTTGRFEETATVIAPTTAIKVLKYVYFPGTQTGFRYDYSPYFGVIHKIWQLRGMTVNSPTLTETGTVSDNPAVDPSNWAAWTRYNYPATSAELPAVPLDDVPTFAWRKDDWQGRTSSVPTTTFASSEDTSGCDPDSGTCTGTRTTIITAPDGSRSVSVSLIRPVLDWQNGLIDETRLETQTGVFTKVWSKTKLYWEQGPDNQLPGRDNPRLNRIEVTNDAEQTRATRFQYDTYNNPIVVKECDFAEPGSETCSELRRTETTYETGSGWINNRLLRLTKEIKTIVGTATVSKTVYEYDKNGEAAATALTPRNDISTSVHNIQYQPSAPPGQQCAPQCDPERYRCCWDVHVYEPRTRFRGNMTKITQFSDASLASDSNAVVTTVKYDIAGSVTESSGSCSCDLKTTQYTNANHYAYPMSETRSGEGLSLTTSVTYDQGTGVILTATDRNGQTSSVTYNPSNVRVIRTDSPNGAWTTTEYNDSVFPYHVKTKTSLDTTHDVSNWNFTNGAGQQFRSRGQTADGYVSSDVEFDIMGRPVKSFNPYTVTNLADTRPSNIKFSEITQRDGLGRTLQTTLPDLTTVSATYNGLVATATDQAGKSRRQLADIFGRTVRVDEPNSIGSLGDVATPAQPTYYEYDGNDNLSKVTQSDGTTTQERRFKYDSLSRLRAEKQVEADATLDIDGVKGPIDPINKFTKVLKYNNEGQLTDGYDSRGINTHFVYDGLNRVLTVTYSGEVGYQTPAVTYTYDQARSGFLNNGALTKVETAAVGDTPATKTEFDYDLVGQVRKHRQWIGIQQYDLEYDYNLAGQLTSEKYPSGRIVTNSYDAYGRLSSLADASRTYVSNLQFQGIGSSLSSITLGNGIVETFQYNDRGQMKQMAWTKNNSVIQRYDYAFGQINPANNTVDETKNNGQLAQIESYIGGAPSSPTKQFAQKFVYDSIGRLERETEYRGDTGAQVYSQKFSYDRFGNRYLKASENPSSQNPLLPTFVEDGNVDRATNRFASNTNTGYDEAGEVTTDNKFRSLKYFFDANGRMIKSSTTTDTNINLAVMDAAGNKVAEKVNDIWRFAIYDVFGKMVTEYGGLNQADDGGVKFIHQDIQGSTRAITSLTASVVSRMDYQAFGEQIPNTIGQRSASGFASNDSIRHRYAMSERDEATNLDDTWWRKNENRAGRWTRPDPYMGSMEIDDPQSFNRFSYVVNEPTNFVDPSGLFWQFLGCRIEFYWRPHVEGGGDWVDYQVCSYQWVEYEPIGIPTHSSPGGGGGGGDPAQPQPPDNKKCKQDKNGGDANAIKDAQEKAGIPKGMIQGQEQSSDSPEGLIGYTTDREGLLAILESNKAIIYNTGMGGLHPEVGKENVDSRSRKWSGRGLGRDSRGMSSSLQMVVGETDPDTGKARVYSDLDCVNPAEGLAPAVIHGAPIVVKRIGRGLKRIFGF